MAEQELQKEHGPFDELANELDDAQKVKNDGRGIGSVQTIVSCLRQGDMPAARAVCWNEADKIVSYPDIRKFLQREFFSGFDEKEIPHHFRASSDRLYDR